MPWTTRKAISEPMFQASPQSSDPARKRVSAPSQTFRESKRSTAQPETGTTVARARRYAVLTHCRLVVEAPRSWPRVCRAMETIVLSRSGARAPRTRMPASLRTAGSRRSEEWTVVSGMVVPLRDVASLIAPTIGWTR